MSGTRGLVVGNSYVGALILAAAQRAHGAPASPFDFAAAGGVNFRRIAVEDGRLGNVRTLEGGICPLAEYGAIFLYGDLPGPVELAQIGRRLGKQRYSAQVIDRALRNAITGAASLTVRDRIRCATQAPILLLPGNPPADAGPTSLEERTAMLALLREMIGADYLPAPAGLLAADGSPNAALYKGSVGIAGNAIPSDLRPKHDVRHLNPAGGALWLATLTNMLRTIVAPVRRAGPG